MTKWKDKQLKQTLMRFFQYLDKRGFLDPMLQCDPEHQIDTFLEQFNNQESVNIKDAEKATELANEYKHYTHMNDINLHLEEKSKEEIVEQCVYAAAMEMAEWKEREMVEKMENFVKGLYLPAYPYIDRENSELIEDIKQAMMEG